MKLRDLILHNFQLKLLSLLMAVLIWSTIHVATKPESNGSLLPFLSRTNPPAAQP